MKDHFKLLFYRTSFVEFCALLLPVWCVLEGLNLARLLPYLCTQFSIFLANHKIINYLRSRSGYAKLKSCLCTKKCETLSSLRFFCLRSQNTCQLLTSLHLFDMTLHFTTFCYLANLQSSKVIAKL